jgi:hypothetical protein
MYQPIQESVNVLLTKHTQTKQNTVVWVRERTIPTEQPRLVGDLRANITTWSARRIPKAVFSNF